ncbi:hypothetical protein GA0070216_11399 [Micromonospora matsumotoense]|uniref:Uncharacterized protein n=1 Tax=Micromonospora matsumotoense TaxID=121616 RepID=A0A1C5A425_9ACTN|nr:hypothetical protein [Micromonospora matsumotoense]SCF39983.1 hypothetical protein GA0070216_11399 [Micromonospora matsumotoense]
MGELLLTLASQGRLVLPAEQADEAIAALELTLSAVRARLRILHIWQHIPTQRVEEIPDELALDVVDALFADQLAPGRLELAVTEIPKYIEALRRARLAPPGADGRLRR